MTPIDLGEDFALDIGRFPDVRCVFDPTTLFLSDRKSEYTVIAWQTGWFEAGGPDVIVQGAIPNAERYPDDPLRDLRRLEERAAAAVEDGARPVFRGTWPGFCAYAAQTCPGTTPAICGDESQE